MDPTSDRPLRGEFPEEREIIQGSRKRGNIEERVQDAGKKHLREEEPASPPLARRHVFARRASDRDKTPEDSPEISRKSTRPEDEQDQNLRSEKRGRRTAVVSETPAGLSIAIPPEAAEKMSDEDFAHQVGEFRRVSDLVVQGAKRLSDAGLIRAIIGNTNLQSLHVIDCKLLKDWLFTVLAKNCPHIRSLSVVECQGVTDESIQAVTNKCGEIQELHIDRSRNLTDRSLCLIAAGCPQLENFTMSESPQYSYEGFADIIESCKKLRLLGLSGCPQVNDGWIEVIINNCPKLEQLDLRGCRNVSEDAIYQLQMHFGNRLQLMR